LALPWSFVSKITNTKQQIPNKSQITSTPPKRRRTGKFQTRAKTIFLFVICFFGHWNLFVICILLFGISPFGHC
jgi:hypothetical protein